MSFDKTDKRNIHITSYFQDKKCLILDNTTMVRSTLNKCLQSIGVLNANIVMFDNLSDAEKYLANNIVHFALVSDLLTGRAGGKFYDQFRKKSPRHLDGGFFVLSEKSSPSMSLQIAIKEIDALVIRPFTMEHLQRLILEAVTPKISPLPYAKALDEAKNYLYKNDLEQAKVYFEEAMKLEKKPVAAFYYLGVCYRQEKLHDEACRYFEQVLEIDRLHYRSLESLYEILLERGEIKKAYELVSIMVDHYPVDANRLPEFTKLMIANQQFDDLVNLCEVFEFEEDFDEMARVSAAAGLALVGKHFLLEKNLKKDGLKILERSIQLAGGRGRILLNIIDSLVQTGEFERADTIMDQLSPEFIDTEEALLLQLEIKHNLATSGESLNFAYKLVELKIRNQRVYDVLIQQSIKMGRSKDKIEYFIQEAVHLFPERESYFIAFLRRL